MGQDATLRQNYITIGRLNDLLDELARRNTKDEKARVLSTIAKSTSPRQMYWVTRIIQKKRPEGTKERELFQLFHEHALEHYKASSFMTGPTPASAALVA